MSDTDVIWKIKMEFNTIHLHSKFEMPGTGVNKIPAESGEGEREEETELNRTEVTLIIT